MRSPKLRHIGLAVTHEFAFFRHVLEGVRRYAEQRPNWIFVSVVPEQQRMRTLGPVPDGLIVSIDSRSDAKALASWKRPVVDVSLLLPGLAHPSVRADNRRVAELGFAHFFERGIRHFAFAGHRRWLYSTQREQMFRDVAQEAGYDLQVYHTRSRQRNPLVRHWPLDNGVFGWLQELPKPTGLFVPSDLWGVQLTQGCRALGIRVPEQVAILGVDNDELICGLSRPPLSSVILPSHQIGFEAARLLDRQIEVRRVRDTQVLLSPVGIETRGSTDILATDDSDVAAAVRFVREHPHLPMRVTDVLRKIPLGKRTLERRIKQFLGHPLKKEIHRVHLQRAQRLLADTNLPVQEVARQSGFTDGRHLAVTFRRLLRQSPTTYRVAHRDRPWQ